MSHEGVLTTVSSRFIVPFIIVRLLACVKSMRNFPDTIAGFTIFLGALDAWFINSVAYSNRCRVDYFRQCFKYIYNGFACDGGGLECTKYCKTNDLVEHGMHELVSYVRC